MNFFAKNWKTSAVGVIGAIPQIVEGIQSKNWSQVATGICTLLLGLFAKDNNVTGGSIVQG